MIKSLITPIQKINNIYYKREDLYSIYGCIGAKSRSAYHLINNAKNNGYKTISTAGSRKSPQIYIVSKIAYNLGLNVYNNVIRKRCKDYCIENNAFEVPFGMVCNESINLTKEQVIDIPLNVKRIVVPVGSAINLIGLLKGLKENNISIPILGVVVGADPTKTLDIYAPKEWRKMVTLIKSDIDCHVSEKNIEKDGIIFDPIYEAKCLKYLKENDLFWIIGIRNSLRDPKIPLNNFSV
jgi:1-aminocyclopropane-1-carboxylate deaminase/D-cysteine desulfhydrase-like pyridoxal-dependent ACC family enzyme